MYAGVQKETLTHYRLIAVCKKFWQSVSSFIYAIISLVYYYILKSGWHLLACIFCIARYL